MSQELHESLRRFSRGTFQFAGESSWSLSVVSLLPQNVLFLNFTKCSVGRSEWLPKTRPRVAYLSLLTLQLLWCRPSGVFKWTAASQLVPSSGRAALV